MRPGRAQAGGLLMNMLIDRGRAGAEKALLLREGFGKVA